MDTYEKKEHRTLTYQDANSLYSWAMSQMFSRRGFELVSAHDEIDILNVPEDNKLGYILGSGFGVPPRSCTISTIYISSSS